MGQCGLWPQEGSREIRTEVEVHNARFTLVIKEDVLSDEERKKKLGEGIYESCKMEAELRVT